VTAITKQQALAYLERWKIVREREARGQRVTTMDERAQQLSVLMASRFLFKHDPNRERLVDEVRQRWMRIHQILDG
jgi:hypothetical protein